MTHLSPATSDDKRRFAPEVVGKYALLQLPGIGIVLIVMLLLQHWFDVPQWTLWLVLSVWILKDAALYPFVWRAYDTKRDSQLHSLLGREAVAKQSLQPYGYVVLDGVLWRAVGERGVHIEAHERVLVMRVQGLTLIVRPSAMPETSRNLS